MPTTTPAEGTEYPRLRLRGRYASRLAGAQAIAEITVMAAAAVVLGMVVFAVPDRLLWPGATGGTPQQWIAAAAVGLLVLVSAGLGRTAVYGDLGLIFRLDSLPSVERFQLACEGRRVARETIAVHLALAALLVAPLGPTLAHAWQVNDPAAVGVLGPQLLVRLAPAVGLHLLYVCLASVLEGLANLLETQQARHALDVEVPTSDDQPVDTVGEDPRRLVGRVLRGDD